MDMGCHTRKSSLQRAMQCHCVASCKENCVARKIALSDMAFMTYNA